jgi:hypothetical protein
MRQNLEKMQRFSGQAHVISSDSGDLRIPRDGANLSALKR